MTGKLLPVILFGKPSRIKIVSAGIFYIRKILENTNFVELFTCKIAGEYPEKGDSLHRKLQRKRFFLAIYGFLCYNAV